LPWPVAGVQVVGFGQPTGKGRRSYGIVIEAPLGTRVVSPCGGLVVYVGEFRTYGTLVIVSAGDGYQCLLGGPLRIDAEVGQQLSAGDPIGVLTRSELDGAAPQLRLELLKNQRPIDPAPWPRRS
jgi:murein hydrolase activator